jgi:hypothetical protein
MHGMEIVESLTWDHVLESDFDSFDYTKCSNSVSEYFFDLYVI